MAPKTLISLEAEVWEELKDKFGWLTPDELKKSLDSPAVPQDRIDFKARVVFRNSFIVKAIVGLKQQNEVILWGQPLEVLNTFKDRITSIAEYLGVDSSLLSVSKSFPEVSNTIYNIQVIGIYPCPNFLVPTSSTY